MSQVAAINSFSSLPFETGLIYYSTCLRNKGYNFKRCPFKIQPALISRRCSFGISIIEPKDVSGKLIFTAWQPLHFFVSCTVFRSGSRAVLKICTVRHQHLCYQSLRKLPGIVDCRLNGHLTKWVASFGKQIDCGIKKVDIFEISKPHIPQDIYV